MASLSGNNKIVLKGDFGQYEEGPLAAAASPGMNVVMTVAVRTQERDTWTPGATRVGGTAAGGAASPVTVVREDGLQGRTVNDAYALGENVFLYKPKKGDVCQVLVKAAEDVDKGEGLSAGADGMWVAATANSVCEAIEDSGGALAANTLMRVRFF